MSPKKNTDVKFDFMDQEYNIKTKNDLQDDC